MNNDIIKVCEEIQLLLEEIENIKSNSMTDNQQTLLIDKYNKLQFLKSKPVFIYAENFVKELSQAWGIDEKQLIVSVDFDPRTEISIRSSKEQYIKYVKNMNNLSMFLKVQGLDIEKYKTRSAQLMCNLNLNTTQKNGKKLEDLVEVVHNVNKQGFMSIGTKLELSDYKNLKLTYMFGDIYNVWQQFSKNSSNEAMALFKSLQIDTESQNNSEPNA